MKKTKQDLINELSNKLNSLPNLDKLNLLAQKTNPTTKLENFNLLTKKIAKYLEDCENQERELRNYPIYNETVNELEKTKEKLEVITNELENFKKDFRLFYERTKPKHQPQQIEYSKTYYLDSELSRNQLKALYNGFARKIFDCDFLDFENLFSSEITIKIDVKKGVTIISVVAFFEALKEKNYIKNKFWADSIVKSETIIFEKKPMTAEQIKTAKKGLKRSFIDSDTLNDIETILE